ncbi:MAG: hypothetical protein RQ736_10020 [Thiogranum sp.]|nr:hypothetical protein [Thiogranum sp.]
MRIAAIFLLFATTCAASRPPDAAAGKELHDVDCLICHQTAHYTRSDRKVDSLSKLERQVDVCQQDVGAEWDTQQLNEVVRYLDSEFYHF